MIKKLMNKLFRGSDVIDYSEAIKLQREAKAMIIDVKTEEEYNKFHVKGAINIPLDRIEKDIGKIINGKHNMLILYCVSGKRAKAAKKILSVKGYDNVFIMYV